MKEFIPVNEPLFKGNEAKYLQECIEPVGFHLKVRLSRNLRSHLLQE